MKTTNSPVINIVYNLCLFAIYQSDFFFYFRLRFKIFLNILRVRPMKNDDFFQFLSSIFWYSYDINEFYNYVYNNIIKQLQENFQKKTEQVLRFILQERIVQIRLNVIGQKRWQRQNDSPVSRFIET